jgi:hypothetical protein
MKIKKPELALAKPRLLPDLLELMKHQSAKNSWAKKLISEDSDFEEPQTLQDFGPFISNAKDLAFYLMNRGFVPCNSIKDEFKPFDISVKYSTKIKIEQKHTEYPSLKHYEIGIYKEDLDVLIKELPNNQTRLAVNVSIHLPSEDRNHPVIFFCFYKIINNTKLQNFTHLMEEALTHFEDAQKYIDSGKELLALVYDIQDVFKPLKYAEN